MKQLVVVGDALLDRDLVGRAERLCPDAPVPVLDDVVEHARPGGAGLAALLAARDGRAVVLITALCDDPPGRRLGRLLTDAGVQVVDMGRAGQTVEKVRVGGAGHPMVRLDYGGRGPDQVGPLPAGSERLLADASAVLVADYGRGVAASASVQRALTALPPRVPVVWDPHPRGPAPIPGVRLATPNAGECGVTADRALADVTDRARALRTRWAAAGLAVTLGRKGALLVEGDGPPLVAPAPAVAASDPCGAGDRFASAAAGLLADGALPSEAVTGGVVAASAFVAAGGAAAIGLPPEDRTREMSCRDGFEVAAAVRAAGGTVVATGGCFDILHAGHVGVLAAARSLGDCLIVCLNSDDSVRRLKGPGRPLQTAEDRTALLLALDSVDGVIVFDEDTPLRVLDQLRPDVFAKGADYSLETLPEAPLLAGWGGQAVVLPYLEGRSTTRLVKEAVRRAQL